MIFEGETYCPKCKGELRYYDSVKRKVLSKNRSQQKIILHRYKCDRCGRYHREFTEKVCPMKRYELPVIQGVILGTITSGTLGFEDYPCEQTMRSWKSEEKATRFMEDSNLYFRRNKQ